MGKYINIILRSTWGAAYGEGWGTRALPAKYVILHHSDTKATPENATLQQEYDAMRYLDQIGYQRFNYADGGYTRPQGSGISYTWAVPKSGRVYEGHKVNRVSSHTAGYNTEGVGIVLIGNYETDVPTAKQIDAIARLVLEAYENGWVKHPKVDFGHRDVMSTACPGKNAYPIIKKINDRIAEIQRGGTTVPVDTNKGFTKEWITEVQNGLKTLGYYSGPISGLLADVDKAVRQFQADNKLTVDGLPGNATLGLIRTKVETYLAEKAKAEREKKVAETIAASRLSGPDRYGTAAAVAGATLPSGRGVLVAVDGSADERYATARAGGQVIYLPVRSDREAPPAATIAAIKKHAPAWVRIVGGRSGVSDATARQILEAAGLL